MDVDRTSWRSTLVKNHNENKTYILVKLSESFANAIQEYSGPTIKFHESRGAIRFQNGKSYDFSVEQSQNSVECIKQTKSHSESVGKVAFCLQVKGKDDVYQRTRTKMEAAEQAKRKYCTKLLTDDGIGNGADNDNLNVEQPIANNHHNNQNNHHRPSPISSSSSSSSSSASTSSSSSSISSTKINHNNNTNKTNNNNSVKHKDNNTDYKTSSEYSDITDTRQLKRFKADFDQDYQEYQSLHGYLHQIEERFRKLKELLKQTVEGSPQWEALKEKIFREYDRFKSDSKFHRARDRYKELYNKLSHIKEKVFLFEKKNKQPQNQPQEQQHHQNRQPQQDKPRHHQQDQQQYRCNRELQQQEYKIQQHHEQQQLQLQLNHRRHQQHQQSQPQSRQRHLP